MSELSAIIKCEFCSAVRVVRTAMSAHSSLAEANHHLNQNQGACHCLHAARKQQEQTMSIHAPTIRVTPFEPVRITGDVRCVLCARIIPEMSKAYSLHGSRPICPPCVKTPSTPTKPLPVIVIPEAAV
ncbi:MAG: hypothetical protein RL095_2158 [Verrucomicrobiota bacterium]|jgi:formylmethanofuran dehydrogenase subunit E